ncbi:MAG: 30S ribosomal protein S18 [Candidatus Magasanikbacteria bacterium GW2011_GWC2_37_14]|uniref:Small ribosomal subunit protein bS18 n=1 Tax=Candidatus Magasanikbacteria bacterium GW2011_GWC2_37_14 TaxID=1619046 RepID=A0A0G0GNU1_9BACT|nr:MAG: 30S ribosomal protein S18 [Candidatus Magasanikbacteria bacterium GW2011_GWC2_37_14]
MMYNNNKENAKPIVRYCHYCVNKQTAVDYKDVQLLRRFVSSYLKIAPQRRSGLCALHQRKVANAIKQARVAGLMGFVSK